MVVMNKYLFIILTLCWTVINCSGITGPEPEFETHLDKVSLSVDDEDYAHLVNESFSNYYIDADLTIGDRSYDVKVRNHGNASRRLYKKSLRVKFEDDNLYNGHSKEMVISSQMRDATYMRYILSLEMFRSAGFHISDCEQVVLGINNENKGIYLLLEPLDAFFLKRRNLPDGNLYGASNNKGFFTFENGFAARSGYNKKTNENGNYEDLENLIYLVDTASDSAFVKNIGSILDVENTIDYYTISILINNIDGIVNNFHIFNNPETGKFEFIPWDLDNTFGGIITENTLDLYADSYAGGSKLFKRLLNIPRFKKVYIEKFDYYMNNVFTEDFCLSVITPLQEMIRHDYQNDPVRTILANDLNESVESLLYFVRERRNELESQMRAWNTVY